jgi:hypothetical protein
LGVLAEFAAASFWQVSREPPPREGVALVVALLVYSLIDAWLL